MLMIPEMLQVVIVGLMILIPLCMIYKKAGFNPAWAALVFLPGFGLLLIFMQLALWPWPTQIAPGNSGNTPGASIPGELNAQHEKEF